MKEENVKIENIAPEGFFFGKSETDKDIYALYTDIGEEAFIEIFRKKRKWYGRFPLDGIKNPSPNRIKPICEHFGQCGGCDLQHLTYEREKEIKKEITENLIEKPISGYIESPKLTHYRNHLAFDIEREKAGFHKKLSNRLLDVHYCHLMDNKINNFLDEVHKIKGDFEGEIKIKTCDNGIIHRKYPKFVSKAATPETLIFARKTIDDIPYYVSPDTFFQSNDHILPLWLNKIVNFIEEEGNFSSLIDLYSGAGTISLRLGKKFKNIFGVENNPLAVYLAKKSIKEMGLSEENVKYFVGDLNAYDIKSLNADILIVNPPRGGLSQNVKYYIKEKEFNTFIYSSCNVNTFARDVKELLPLYELTEYYIVDMFPRTFHFEVLGKLKKRR